MSPRIAITASTPVLALTVLLGACGGRDACDLGADCASQPACTDLSAYAPTFATLEPRPASRTCFVDCSESPDVCPAGSSCVDISGSCPPGRACLHYVHHFEVCMRPDEVMP